MYVIWHWKFYIVYMHFFSWYELLNEWLIYIQSQAQVKLIEWHHQIIRNNYIKLYLSLKQDNEFLLTHIKHLNHHMEIVNIKLMTVEWIVLLFTFIYSFRQQDWALSSSDTPPPVEKVDFPPSLRWTWPYDRFGQWHGNRLINTAAFRAMLFLRALLLSHLVILVNVTHVARTKCEEDTEIIWT